MEEIARQRDTAARSLFSPIGWVGGVGSLALFASLLVIVLSVAGRHSGLLLPGSVEIAEVLFVVVAASSMVLATVERSHAAARLFLDWLSPTSRRRVVKCGTFLGAILCLALTAGNLWLLYDVWTQDESTHLLGIPLVPFRIVLTLATAIMAALLVRQLFADDGDEMNGND